MTHDSAVRIVVGLVPEIEKQGASTALTNYAEGADLPPAQLEKLAQVFNTLRTVSHIDNAKEASRGDTVALIDVPSLIVDYASGRPQEKAASPLITPTHDSSMIDLNHELRLEISPAPIIEKAASAPAGTPALVYTSDEASEALAELEWDLRVEMSKLASPILANAETTDVWGRDISDFEREALYEASVEQVKAAGDWMEKFAEPHHITLTRHDYTQPLAKRAFDATTDDGKAFAKLATTLATYNEVVKMAGRTDLPGVENPDAETKIEPHDPRFKDEDDNADHAQADDSGGVTLEDLATEENIGTGAPPIAGGDTSGIPAGARESADTEGSKKKSKNGESEEGKTKKKSKGGRVLDAVKAPVKAVGGAIQGAASKADAVLQSVTAKERSNKGQRATDLQVSDIRRAMNVQRMIGTDPVLRESDPKEVLEIYNSISELHPELAGNIPALRLLLREAVSYEGLTLDSQKQLSDVRKGTAQSESQEEDNDRRRYSVGGAGGINL